MISTDPAPIALLAMTGIPKHRIRRHFDKASQSYQTHNDVQQRIARVLLERLAMSVSNTPVLLDIGCGPGPDWPMLARFSQHYVGVDLSAAMLAAHLSTTQGRTASLLQADMENLPLANACIDMLYSNMALQWAGHRQQLCHELKRVLKSGADAFISVPLQGSLEPLGQFRQTIDGQSQVNPQPDMQTWLDEWTASGWIIQAYEQRRFTEYFADLSTLLQSIKGVGAGANSALPLTRATLRTLASDYENARSKLGLPLHYEIAIFHLTKG